MHTIAMYILYSADDNFFPSSFCYKFFFSVPLSHTHFSHLLLLFFHHNASHNFFFFPFFLNYNRLNKQRNVRLIGEHTKLMCLTLIRAKKRIIIDLVVYLVRLGHIAPQTQFLYQFPTNFYMQTFDNKFFLIDSNIFDSHKSFNRCREWLEGEIGNLSHEHENKINLKPCVCKAFVHLCGNSKLPIMARKIVQV